MAPRPAARRHATASTSRWRLVTLAAIAAITCLVYANSLAGPFVFDDRRAIVENPSIRQLSPIADVLRPPAQSPVTGRPIANLSLAINYALGGLDVAGYHAWNIAMHVLVALALFGVLRRMLAWLPSSHGSQPAGDAVAGACVLIWAVHPLNTEVVNYVTQRTESMAALFYLLTLYAAMRANESGRPASWTAAAAVFNICGIATKESVITAPLMVMMVDRVFAFDSFRAAWGKRWPLYAALAAGWALFAVLSRDTPFFRADGFELHVGPWAYLLQQAPLILRYLRLSVWPDALVFDYGVAGAATFSAVWPSVLVLAGLLAATVVLLRRRPRVGIWGVWFFMTLAPASSLIPIPTEVGAERRMYMPLMAVMAITAIGVHAIIARVPRRSAMRWGTALVLVAAAGLSTATVRRNAEYRSGLSLWQTVVERRPQPRAHTMLALALRDAGRDDDALRHLRLAAPHWPDARLALGSALRARGELEPAMVELRAFIRERPASRDIVSAHMELASALAASGDPPGAIVELRTVVALAPQFAGGRVALADLLFSAGDFAAAAAEYREHLRLQAATLPVLVRLGLAQAGSGERDAAIETFRRALAVEPRSMIARRALLDMLRQERRFQELEVEARATLGLDPDDPRAHNLLGIALASRQQLDDAIEAFAAAVRLDPGFDEARENLRQASRLQRRATGGL